MPSTQSRDRDFLPIDFLIIGGSIAGLTAAIALRRAGHKVTVVDQDDPFKGTPIDAGCRLPPNSTKVYYRWGLKARLHACAVKSKGTLFAQYDSGSVIGVHEWQEDVLQETGGDFLLVHYTDVRRILAECAVEHGATLRYGPECFVMSVTAHATAPSITLRSGEVLTADVVVGADGYIWPGCLTREYLFDAHGQEDTKTPTGMQLFNVIIREADVPGQEERTFLEKLRTSGYMITWFGSEYGVFGYPMKETSTGEPAFTLFVYAPMEDRQVTTAVKSSRDALLHSLKDADPRLTELAKHTVTADVSIIPMSDYPMLEDWVHPDGRVISIGEAAHPIALGSIYAFGMSTGDAAVLGRLFKHLHRCEQIDSFLSAVQEIRQERVNSVMRASAGNIFAVSLPPGMAETRDRELRERAEKGLQGLASGRASTQMMETVEDVFGYDPEDEADNWWIEWGLMQERVQRLAIRDSVPSVTVVEEEEAKVVSASAPDAVGSLTSTAEGG